jgi:drug/metabolite transporter (DMT)-like permease
LKKISPRGIVIIGVFFSSLSSILVRLSNAPSMVIATYRLALTVLMLLPFFYVKNRTQSRWMTRKSAILCGASGVFLAFHFLTWFVSLRHTSIASSTILVNTHPIIIVLGSFFILGERIKRKALLFIGMTIVGSLIISLGDYSRGGDSLFGDLMALLGALSVSGYILIGRVVRQKMPLPLYTFTVYLSATLVLLFLDLVTGTPLFPYTLREFIIFFALAFFCTIGGHTVLNWALRWVEPAFISTAILGEPVFASVAALFLFNEVPSFYTLIGGAVVLSGIYLFIRVKNGSGIPV